MIINKHTLIRLEEDLHYHYQLAHKAFDKDPYLRGLKNIEGEITITKDAMGDLKAIVNIAGQMICPCAITLEDVIVPFAIKEDVPLVFTSDQDGFEVGEKLDLDELVYSLIWPQVPIKIVKNAEIEYPKGDGWRVVKEETYEQDRAGAVDPRLAILKDYQFDEEE